MRYVFGCLTIILVLALWCCARQADAGPLGIFGGKASSSASSASACATAQVAIQPAPVVQPTAACVAPQAASCAGKAPRAKIFSRAKGCNGG
jgi:hypothetical protein